MNVEYLDCFEIGAWLCYAGLWYFSDIRSVVGSFSFLFDLLAFIRNKLNNILTWDVLRIDSGLDYSLLMNVIKYIWKEILITERVALSYERGPSPGFLGHQT